MRSLVQRAAIEVAAARPYFAGDLEANALAPIGLRQPPSSVRAGTDVSRIR